MDTQTQVILFHGLSLAKKHFKPKTIEVMVATTILDASYLAPLQAWSCNCARDAKHVIE